MKKLILFDLTTFGKGKVNLIIMVFLFTFGVWAGGEASFTISDNLAYDSPYQISYIVAFLSLASIFFSTLFTGKLALREMDSNFNLIFFSLPITLKLFLWSRISSIFILSSAFTFLLSIGFFVGREMETSDVNKVGFSIFNYVLPFLTFTVINTLFVLSVTILVAWASKSKMMVYVSGLVLYIIYMAALLFSNSPFMANNLPQSKNAQIISSIVDPFGISAFFYTNSTLTVDQKNTELLSLSGYLLINRLGIVIISIMMILLAINWYSISTKQKKSKVVDPDVLKPKREALLFAETFTNQKNYTTILSSYVKIYSKYIVKSIPFIMIVLSLVFAVGMEIYAEIEKGVRLPQKFASSGLMTSTIIQNFYFLAALIMAFYANDLYWKSENSNFHLIEKSTPRYKLKTGGVFITLIIISIFFSFIMLLEGLTFQSMYKNYNIEWDVYSKIFLLTTLPLMLVSSICLLINKIVNHRYISLGLSILTLILFTTSISRVINTYPLTRFLYTISFDYSDMNGFGIYEQAYLVRLCFGFLVVAFVWFLTLQNKTSLKRLAFWVPAAAFIISMAWIANKILEGYLPTDEKLEMEQAVDYEIRFRGYQNIAEPTITDLKTTIDLFPSNHSYRIEGSYILENKTKIAIDSLLINFADGFEIKKAFLLCKNEKIAINEQYKTIYLQESLLPGEKMNFEFEMLYHWIVVNGHQSFNAIVDNGSFMRISRFYPVVGYIASKEIEDIELRNQYKLGEKTKLKPLEAPKDTLDDFIALDMTVSTEQDQTVVGIGELTKEWKAKNRNYYQFQVEAIPFRFGVSSAKYAVKRETYHGIKYEIYYHPDHPQNVDHLLKNAKITMDYCQNNFGPYPFKTIRFAEISSFTSGFAATAYPTSIYMIENMIFHSNIAADQQQDVINELAGHELAHLWWGNNQIDPDYREGDVMLTETLAMYTEVMLLKKMYGKQIVERHLSIHKGIFENVKGFNGDKPLIKATSEDTHISYSKGALAMYHLSEMIGEDKVNEALKNFLIKNKYPNPKPISTDFVDEVLAVADQKFHPKIEGLFKK
jgi:hypothetical protein